MMPTQWKSSFLNEACPFLLQPVTEKGVDWCSTFVSHIVPEPVSNCASQLRLPSVKHTQDSPGWPSAAQFSRVLV